MKYGRLLPIMTAATPTKASFYLVAFSPSWRKAQAHLPQFDSHSAKVLLFSTG
jgi:hypothetical protein